MTIKQAIEALEQFTHLSNNQYCHRCGGWEVEKGRGCTPGVHTKNCTGMSALAALRSLPGLATEDEMWELVGYSSFKHDAFRAAERRILGE